ncbi:MAG TPA: hypothetical protein PL017_04305 [Tenuifilaceae bacterium]|nr:hypothetical protein [Tenuifilaceae bacterium]HPE17807.1 hypothetical protein [Tenuifilaceae bacterium]HPJ45296.1 hypothetical protein [Tenuifilaceae bacterium]HPQ33643.1 hypothetical protein [Tenuifilaceae bacterium]HRX67291.1 hypothetical protein [Tenuifilaceae bacterium]
MKTIIKLFLLMLCTTAVMAQEQPQQPKEPVDTIILISGRKVMGMVQMVSNSRITYFPEGKKEFKEMDRKQVQSIIYRNGRIEKFNTPAVEMVAEGNWKTIVLTDNPSDVEGLFDLGKIDAQSSPRSRSAKSAQRSADIRLQKKAAAMGGIMILVTKRESKGGYGEIPTHLVEGNVYGFDPPVENN